MIPSALKLPNVPHVQGLEGIGITVTLCHDSDHRIIREKILRKCHYFPEKIVLYTVILWKYCAFSEKKTAVPWGILRIYIQGTCCELLCVLIDAGCYSEMAESRLKVNQGCREFRNSSGTKSCGFFLPKLALCTPWWSFRFQNMIAPFSCRFLFSRAWSWKKSRKIYSEGGFIEAGVSISLQSEKLAAPGRGAGAGAGALNIFYMNNWRHFTQWNSYMLGKEKCHSLYWTFIPWARHMIIYHSNHVQVMELSLGCTCKITQRSHSRVRSWIIFVMNFQFFFFLQN